MPKGYELNFMEMPSIKMTADGQIAREVFYWTNTENSIVISPLFVSEIGAKKWLNFTIANDMLECRKYQLGYHCMMFHDGNFFWYDDISEQHYGPDFEYYSDALTWKYLNSNTGL